MTSAFDPEVMRRLEAAGQGQLVDHARMLPPRAADAFLREADAQPWAELKAAVAHKPSGVPPVLLPPRVLTLRQQPFECRLRKALVAKGRELRAGGRVATLLLAGGQGTRLGLAGPKGAFVFGPDADRTLYTIQAERVVAAGREVGREVPFFVLVSEATEEATREAFERGHHAWGLAPDQVRLVRQRRLPVLDEQGRALLEAPGRLATAPDGHGGALGALWVAGILAELAAAGVDVLTTFQVDNPLALPVDPVMLGWMVEQEADAVGKAVRRLPGEKVGLFARDLHGRHRVVEYTEFPEGGFPEDLTMGSIALHAFSVRWLMRLFEEGLELPLHRALKKAAYMGPDGKLVRPDAPNAWKLERFIFDVFPLAERAAVQEVAREREFAPVKNAEGVDSPESARALVAVEVRRFYEAHGRQAPEPPALRPLDMLDVGG